jgi:hypothetical protein
MRYVRGGAATISKRQEIRPDQIRDMRLQAGEMHIDFLAEDFLLSFSQPNFYFHATTAYDILRANSVPLGKHDFNGRVRKKA